MKGYHSNCDFTVILISTLKSIKASVNPLFSSFCKKYRFYPTLLREMNPFFCMFASVYNVSNNSFCKPHQAYSMREEKKIFFFKEINKIMAKENSH